ncbi:hypothetical protein V1264_017198 [Littorina saxatilis]|uniref:UPAR/Ly6 domain-containing protein n=1 Tax=Littorina saxatilis TaxID=31220 RepID=A0AAN9GFJ0_9CAEN
MIKLRSSLWYQGASYCLVIILGVSCLFEGTDGLECYSCHFKTRKNVCEQTEITCKFGETCLNVVYRRPLLGIVYSKGCKHREECHAVQNLNDRRICDATPSECVYCCDDDLCNDANMSVTSRFVVVVVAMVTPMFVYIM